MLYRALFFRLQSVCFSCVKRWSDPQTPSKESTAKSFSSHQFVFSFSFLTPSFQFNSPPQCWISLLSPTIIFKVAAIFLISRYSTAQDFLLISYSLPLTELIIIFNFIFFSRKLFVDRSTNAESGVVEVLVLKCWQWWWCLVMAVLLW